MRNYGTSEETIGTAHTARQAEECRGGIARGSEGQDREAGAEEAWLERLKSLHNLGDVVAGGIYIAERNYETARLLTEGPCTEKYLHGNVALEVHIRRKRFGVSDASDFIFRFQFPTRGRLITNLLDDAFTWENMKRALLQVRQNLSDDTVLVGVGEAVHDVKGVAARVFLSVERLHVPNVLESNGNAAQWPLTSLFSWDSNEIVTDGFFVSVLRAENRKLVVVCEGDIAGPDKGGDDIVQSATQVVHYIAEDDAQAVFTRMVDLGQVDDIPPAIFVDLSDTAAIRIALCGNAVGFSLQGFRVFARPCDLCV